MGLKILHSADWHLDSPFTSFPEEQRSFLLRRQRQIPDLFARLCRQEQCDLVLLSGDIFDGPCTRETLRILCNALAECAVPVFIAPGNHDFCAPGSPWLEELWPDNVHIFAGAMAYADLPELNCRIYGAGYTAMDCPPLLTHFRAEGSGYNIALLHGDPTAADSPYCPVTAQQAERSGLDYLALGHIHKAGSFTAGKTLCGWPGCPMGRGWDETGSKGVYIVTLDGKAALRSVTLDALRFQELEVPIDEDAVAALDRVLPAAESDDFFRVTLTGTGTVDMNELYEAFSNLPHLELRDRTQPPLELWEDVGSDTLRGVFFGMLQTAEQSALPEDAARIRLAAEISKKLLEGREVILP